MLELRRKILHVLFGTILALLFFYDIITQQQATIILILTALGVLIFTHFRNKYTSIILNIFERQRNINSFPATGAFTYVLGCTLAIWLYDKDIATASILILAIGDGIGGFVGKLGTLRYFKTDKTWEGILFAIAGSTAACSFFVPFIDALITSTSILLIEALGIHKEINTDDNLLIPLLSGLLLTLLH